MKLQTSTPISPDWLARSVLAVAPDLIGCWLVRRLPGGQVWRGMITETEAYGPGDPACHGYRKMTARNRPMFGPPGLAYVYLIYGIYHCLNIVTDAEQVASAVLIRAISLDAATITEIQATSSTLPVGSPATWANGPGKLCRLFQIDRQLSGACLGTASGLWLEHCTMPTQPKLMQTPRIGLSQGQDLPWRWYTTVTTKSSIK